MYITHADELPLKLSERMLYIVAEDSMSDSVITLTTQISEQMRLLLVSKILFMKTNEVQWLNNHVIVLALMLLFCGWL